MPVTILNFHGVGPLTREIDAGERNCWLEQNFFEAVLDLACGQPHVQLTFDDGNTSDLELALPALQKRNLKATFFICSGRLNQSTFLTPDQVLKLQTAGMEIGSHGVDHIPWRKSSTSQLQAELTDSKSALERICGRPVTAAACPFGSYDRRVLSSLHHAGYKKVFTSDGGTASPHQWLQARTTITRSQTLDQIEQLIQGRTHFSQQIRTNIKILIKRLR